MREVDPDELDMWRALFYMRQFECPSCGHEARDMMTVVTKHVKCPICKYEYERTTQASETGVNR